MGDDRFKLTSDGVRVNWGEVAGEMLGKGGLAIGTQIRGFGSTVFELRSQDDGQGVLALRVPIVDDEGRAPKKIWNNLLLADKSRLSLTAGAPGLLGMLGIDNTGEARWLSIYEVLPDNIRIVAEVLELLPPGKAVAEVLADKVGGVDVREIYHAVGVHMAQTHTGLVPTGEDVLRKQGVWHLMDGNERLTHAVLPYLRTLPWVDNDLLDKIEAKTRVVLMAQLEGRVAVRPTHGDYWEANWWWSDEGRLYSFDQAMGYGPVGVDVGFAIGRQLIHWLVGGDVVHRDLIDELLQSYQEEGGFAQEAMEQIYPALVFKLLVGAAFDRDYDELTQQRLLRLADGLLDQKLANPGLKFELDQARDLWQSIK